MCKHYTEALEIISVYLIGDLSTRVHFASWKRALKFTSPIASQNGHDNFKIKETYNNLRSKCFGVILDIQINQIKDIIINEY